MQFSDPYAFRARIQPALVVVLPLGFLMFALLPGYHLFVVAFFGLLSAAGGTAIVSQLGRDRGRKKQSNLWRSWGGSSTTRLLRHRKAPGDPVLQDTLRQQVEKWADSPLPTVEDEEACPVQAGAKYDEVVTSLREATRDRDRFPLVFAENVNYGFRRNLWGLRSIGASLALAVAMVSWTSLLITVWGRPWPDPWWGILAAPDSIAVIRISVSIANTAFVAFWLFWVRSSWVKIVADEYAIRLIESVQTLNRDQR